ncbi:MAG: rRNA maturation RNase YbeY, partial [Candidatus Omnitrophica bacterium]|nr:rRNA maturation RNase YbeY [Candidatus Omnitrophota bacterium]
MNIDIMDLQDCVKIDKRSVIKCAKTVLNVMGEKRAELSLLFVNDSYIKRLNWQYRRLRSKTDVLAFSMRSEKALGDVSKNILGDVVVSTETAKKEAKKRNIPIVF